MEMNPSIVSSQIHVLLVEESLAALTGLKHLMEPTGVQIKTAPDAQTAFDLVQLHPFDLIITNLILQGHSGNELCLMIRNLEKEQGRKPTTIIGITGQALEKITDDALNAGMNQVYKKPISSNDLKTWVESLSQQATSIPAAGAESSYGVLGFELPDTEAELFELSKYPLLDLRVGIEIFQDEAVARDVLQQYLVDKDFANDLRDMNEAHERGDWKMVEMLAHKIKGGVCYGTVRMYYATLYMERYLKAGHSYCQEELYTQMSHVIDESLAHLKEWFNKGLNIN